MTFEQALLTVYRQKPCQLLPNALWKTWRELDSCSVNFEGCADNPSALTMKSSDKLLLMWNLTRSLPQNIHNKAQDFSLMLVHEDYIPELSFPYTVRGRYFRIKHNLDNLASSALPPGFYFADVKPHCEYKAVSELISQCYENIHPSPEAVKQWLASPVYSADLWVWVMDEKLGVPAGLGVADLDPRVPEVSLEWIQLLPDYRGRGLGKPLVYELLCRAKNKALFATVSGDIDNPNNPEALYRKCGFSGSDIWYVLTPRA